MKDCRMIGPREPTSSGGWRWGSSSDLQPLVEQTPKRVRALALSLGAFATGGVVLNAIGPTVLGWHSTCARIGAGVDAALVVLAIGLLLYIKHGAWTAKRLIHFGLVFVILNAFAIAMMEAAYPEPMGISFVAVLIVLFPLFIPTGLGKTMLSAYGAALMSPLAGWIYQVVTGNPGSAGDGMTYVFNFITATLAIVPALTMRGLGKDMNRARQMGSYELSDLIGRGGMGEVWRASHRMLRRPAAIKLIHPERMGAATPEQSERMLRRFEREAQATAGLHSPHTIQIYDFGSTDDGQFYYVMELLDGFDLDTLVKRFGPVSPARAIHLLKQVCDSLEDAHRSGLIHRDIKPANIFLCRYGHKVDFVKVLDFGLVKSRELSGAENTALTMEGATAGTPASMAPEMAVGEDEVDHRVDIYALGCVAYWLLTGQLVFEATNPMKMVLRHVQETPVAPSQRSEVSIPPALDELVLACLAKDPKDRPASAEALADRLEAIAADTAWTRERAQRWWDTHEPIVTGEHSVEELVEIQHPGELRPVPSV